MELLELWLKRWHRIPDADARALVAGTFNLLGTHLWKLALDNQIGAEIIRVLAAERKLPPDERTPLRIRISVSEDAGESLGSLPWEFTRYPGDAEVGSFFLASATSLVFGRWVGEVPAVDIRTATDGVVRVLFISALPAADEFADERERFAGMRDELKKLRQQGQGPALDVLEPIESWQPEEIERVLKEHSRQGRHIDVVHLIAVCRGDGRNGSRLMRQLDDGRLVFEPAHLFAEALIGDDLEQPGLVVLHLSDDTRPDEEVSEHFERLAPKFIKAGVPAVLAMQYPLTKGKDVTFLKSFYGKLIGGQSIGAAVQESRKALSPRGERLDRHFGSVVLYSQSSSDGYLLEVAGAGDEPDGVREEWSLSPRSAAVAGGIDEKLDQWRWDAEVEGGYDEDALEALADWIVRQPWPPPDEGGWRRARRALQLRRREVQDDEEARRATEYLIRRAEQHRRETMTPGSAG